MRWLSHPVAIALAGIVLSQCLIETSANAVFELRLKKFSNRFGKDTEGHCCSGYRNSQGHCTGTCKTKFRVCLKVYQEVIDPESPCTFGEAETPVLGDNEVDFSKVDLQGFRNPVPFELASWQGTFSLIIEAWHEEPNTTATYVEPALITRLMIQRWLDLGEEWTGDDHRTSHSSLSYEFRVTCQENYYGEGCRKWCKPRNDSFGRYVCDDQGEYVCLDGWQGPDNYCLKPICSPGCHESTGYCDQPNECKCHSGWKGPNCDQCQVYPGCLHGTCEKQWQCNCIEGWGGLFCNQDLNFCTNHRPCKNGATCFNTAPGSYSCECPPGFSGTICEIINDTCANTPCRNGGTCLDAGDDQFVCQCPSGFTGQYCEISGQSCSDRPCLNGASCSDTATGYECHCRAGYEGTSCERPVNECASDPCLNGGSCVDEHDGFQCVCPVGYTGDRCQTNVDDCAHRPCLNGGTCIDGLDSFTCRCIPGFLGTLCQTNVDDCRTQPCANGGTCVDGVNDFSCECRPGWGGRQCTTRVPVPVSPCASAPCHNGGYCVEAPELAVGFQCTCPSGLGGPFCTVVTKPAPQVDVDASPMSAAQVVLVVTFSVAVPVLAVVSALAIVCMKRRRRRERARQDEEARRQNEQNMVHNAVNAANNKCLEDHMIINSLDYPAKPLNTQHHALPHLQGGHHLHLHEPDAKKAVENTYSIVPARSTKTINTDVSRLSLADCLEKGLDAPAHAPACRGTPTSELNAPCKVLPEPPLPRVHSHSDVYSKRNSLIGSGGGGGGGGVGSGGGGSCDIHTSTNTLTSTCTPSTCTTPSSVFVIEEHYDDENYIATEV
ncbi:delta-like protein B [Penaeus vannamei]|uniref:Delta-like protein n=1 Tax=Penaeus vannamei TaxID=6689 RepID=A0A385Z8N9_PENVA|nr:Delta [Penaeus vannamei]